MAPETPLLGSTALNFEALKERLVTSEDLAEVCGILEALRWRIANTPNVLEKRENCILLTSNDMLEGGVCKSLLETGRLAVVEHLLALINALAGDYEGRSYLIKKDALLARVLQLMLGEPHESFVRRVCLLILQKLSLRTKVQDFLVENQVISFAVRTLLEELDELSDLK